ncbi:hypothetical protein J2X02_000901 [Pseudoxanthomonas japonensis]|uniref:hypothetical protein n=1 Tax=Pseudoxanthomonas japonensis TaxID=69284 RepID=UPI00285BCBF3|nr:hypothetical protein [Pseudoxanthomonas japonensis]MDR7068084.1 hypothetical protein [Pseudoxanthomonas japonensis]
MTPVNEEVFVVDELGQQVSLIRVTPGVDDNPHANDGQAGGAAEFRTADGLRVIALDDGTFQAEATGTRFRPAQ